MTHEHAPSAMPWNAERLRAAAYDATTAELTAAARSLKIEAFGSVITYSRKVFIPLTQLCRDVCHYCTFAKAPRAVPEAYMSLESVLAAARRGKLAGCKEALFTLGERPELRYAVAADWLAANGYESTIAYVAAAARAVFDETGLLPHVNAGTLTDDEIDLLRPVAPSFGLMLESASSRLCERGMPHHGSPDKLPDRRLDTLERLGTKRVPTTTGLLIGIGETVDERIDALLALRSLQDRRGHLQEVIIQNFRAKPGTRMHAHPEPDLDQLVRTIALARLAFGASLSIQAPPNLSPGLLPALLDAGLDDWGGISPVTPDFVNPEAPWPHLEALATQMAERGLNLTERLTVYPAYCRDADRWLDRRMAPAVLNACDVDGLARTEDWRAGEQTPPPERVLHEITAGVVEAQVSARVRRAVEKAASGRALSVDEISLLFGTRGADFGYVCQSADALRRAAVGDVVTYVVTRNINYTNVCKYACAFCAFSKGKTHEELRGRPYDLPIAEIERRAAEAWSRGATEVCMQGGIHPAYTGTTYLDICDAAQRGAPGIHVHAFSPLEVSQGAATLGLSVREFLRNLKDAGLGSLPGTAAEILDDDVRDIICPDKLTTDQWLSVIEAAHDVGLRTTATIMFGHVERRIHWARHISRLRSLQERTGGITEFVPLPFVARESPIYLKGRARPGPTFREAILMHAVARLAFHTVIPNIQASWVKLGPEGIKACLAAGVNDLGGTLMNESITRAAGASHGQEARPETLEEWIIGAGRTARQRTTMYGVASQRQVAASFDATELAAFDNSAFHPTRRISKRVIAAT
ncbi:5-amino-6-(D-ribitylamino)uracil--L-tyrosine 4-hydroxyphenyl transferase CofH [Xanthobacteraceae bacterium A53D]